MTPTEGAQLREIHRLLDEAYRHYFENSDGHCKSSEGYVAVEYGDYWKRQETGGPVVTGVEIYSYVLGPSRTHRFASLSEALNSVRRWHAEEMAQVYTDDGWGFRLHDNEMKWRR